MSSNELINQVIPLLLVIAFLLALLGGLKRVMIWRQGQASAIYWSGLLSMPKRYLVDLHHVVARDKYMANTHVATGGGFVVSIFLILIIYLFELQFNITIGLLSLSLLIMTIGALFVWVRRFTPPPNLSKGKWQRLPKSLLIFSLSFSMLTLILVGMINIDSRYLMLVLLLFAIVWGLAEMVFGMTWGGPMKHAFAGALHLAFHRRPTRFNGGNSTGLIPIKVDTNNLGVAKPSDFKWNQLLSFDACVECGRCEKVCPAFAAGQPLNPKKLVQDMVVGMVGGSDAKYSGSRYPSSDNEVRSGSINSIIVDGLIPADTIWACTTCRACVEECPMMIEHVDAIVDMRRFETLQNGNTPGKGAEILENLIFTDNPNGHAPQSRMHWAADQNLMLFGNQPNQTMQADVLLWIGDAAFDMRNQRTLVALIQLLRAAKVDFAVLGDAECDCGDVARRLGDEVTFQRLAVANINTMTKYQFKTIVTADPHVFHCFSNEYGAFGLSTPVVHHSTFLAQLVKQKRLRLGTHTKLDITYHDPCYLGRYNGEYDAPRYLLAEMGLHIKEMERSQSRSRCCGGGGGAPITDIAGEQRIADMRMQDAQDVAAKIVAVACPQCNLMLEGVVEPRPEVKDIAELMQMVLIEESV
ncbi:(Fe-S)-binding protein [Shewanella marina]|uniref:(Fe-S)-binding protein n=1 Tax=Shewanella marina TaxID=487319 RepID=UPI00046FC4E8|nr:(Fe-S)-binding protein [Shewanella marina]